MKIIKIVAVIIGVLVLSIGLYFIFKQRQYMVQRRLVEDLLSANKQSIDSVIKSNKNAIDSNLLLQLKKEEYIFLNDDFHIIPVSDGIIPSWQVVYVSDGVETLEFRAVDEDTISEVIFRFRRVKDSSWIVFEIYQDAGAKDNASKY